MKTQLTKSMHCILDGASGQYIPKRFAREFDRACLSGVKADDLDYLARGPGGCLDDNETLAEGETVRGEFYWDTWQDVLDNCILTDPESGNRFRLYQDDSVFIVPEDWEWDDATNGFRPPESETLRRYELPSYWASYLINGDASGIDDADIKACDVFIAREELVAWTCADCSQESHFSWSNDSGNGLGGDVLEYTFIKIA